MAGVIRFPNGDEQKATPNLVAWITRYKSLYSTVDSTEVFDPRWNRAVAGWRERLSDKMLEHVNLNVES